MLQEYVPNIIVVSFLCCIKYFHVTNSKCFIWILHMFHTYVASICSKCFICFTHMLHSSVSCFRGIFRESWGHGPGVGGRGTTRRGPADEAHDAPGILRAWHARPHPSSQVPLARRERRVRGEGVVSAGRGEARQTGAGYVYVVGRGRWGKIIAIRKESGAFLLGNRYPIGRSGASYSQTQIVLAHGTVCSFVKVPAVISDRWCARAIW
jgi:hypothetical protein